MAMGGGQSLEFHAPIYCGEAVFGMRTIVDVEEKQGRSGLLDIVARAHADDRCDAKDRRSVMEGLTPPRRHSPWTARPRRGAEAAPPQ